VTPEIKERFEKGIRSFNQGDFFEAHELWEENWKLAEGKARLFFQGIIQAAVALLHAQRGNYAGALSVYFKSRQNLAQTPPIWMGIDMEQLRFDLMRYFAAIQTAFGSQRGDCEPGNNERAADGQRPPTINQRLPPS
jgi:predicted metal-dependent hydrolase